MSVAGENGHAWAKTGLTIDTYPSFQEEHCTRCGAIAWGGSRTGEFVPDECHGDREAFQAWNTEAVKEHNRKAAESWRLNPPQPIPLTEDTD